MTNAEREKRLAAIRERWLAWAQIDAHPSLDEPSPDEVILFLAELDAATQALHDLKEETGYADGFKAGLEEGARRKGGEVVCPGHPGHDWARGAGPLGEPWRVCLRCGQTEPHPGAAPETEAEPLWPTPAG